MSKPASANVAPRARASLTEPPITQSSGLLAGLLLMAALAFGGGGSPNPLPEMILEVLAAVALVLWAFGIFRSPSFDRVPRVAWIMVMIIVSIPLLQLIPLPPFVWHALPGREIENAALSLINEQSSWRAWSLAPARTLSSLLSLGPPLVLLVMASALDETGRIALIRAIAIMVIATLVLGALQHGAGVDSVFHIYPNWSAPLTGFQANSNATADLLLIGLLAGPTLVRAGVAARLVPDKAAAVLSISALSMAVCAVSVVLTYSRAGIGLLPIPIFACAVILRPWISIGPRKLLVSLIAILVAIPICVILAQTSSMLGGAIARFNFSTELRPEIWRDGLFVAQKYFPFGVGMGDFAPAFVANEPLESVRQILPNRAHNELIELIVETGIFGMLAISAIGFLLTREVLLNVRKADQKSTGIVIFASTALIIIALHSMGDYPLRSLSLASLAAVCAALIINPKGNVQPAISKQPDTSVNSK